MIMETRGGECTEAKEPERVKEIPMLIGILGDGIEQLQGRLTDLEGKVSSVHVAFPIEGVAKVKNPEDPATELGKSIQNIINRVAVISERMRDLHKAIEL